MVADRLARPPHHHGDTMSSVLIACLLAVAPLRAEEPTPLPPGYMRAEVGIASGTGPAEMVTLLAAALDRRAADDYAAVTVITFEAGSYYKNASVRGTIACDGQPARAVPEVQASRALVGWKVATKALATLMIHESGCTRR